VRRRPAIRVGAATTVGRRILRLGVLLQAAPMGNRRRDSRKASIARKFFSHAQRGARVCGCARISRVSRLNPARAKRALRVAAENDFQKQLEAVTDLT
jgi:hypothetical protein